MMSTAGGANLLGQAHADDTQRVANVTDPWPPREDPPQADRRPAFRLSASQRGFLATLLSADSAMNPQELAALFSAAEILHKNGIPLPTTLTVASTRATRRCVRRHLVAG